MNKPLPLIDVHNTIHYAMPLLKTDVIVDRNTICGISTMIPGRRIPNKDNEVQCKTCIAVVRQVRNHT